MTTLIKLNFRHSLKTMREQLAAHNQTIVRYDQQGCAVHEILEANDADGRLTMTCGVFYNAKDCADYINKLNGLA